MLDLHRLLCQLYCLLGLGYLGSLLNRVLVHISTVFTARDNHGLGLTLLQLEYVLLVLQLFQLCDSLLEILEALVLESVVLCRFTFCGLLLAGAAYRVSVHAVPLLGELGLGFADLGEHLGVDHVFFTKRKKQLVTPVMNTYFGRVCTTEKVS